MSKKTSLSSERSTEKVAEDTAHQPPDLGENCGHFFLKHLVKLGRKYAFVEAYICGGTYNIKCLRHAVWGLVYQTRWYDT